MQTSLRLKFGRCPLCERKAYLTFHHLIPRKLHRRTFFRKNFDREILNQGINICRLCHNGIHKQFDEMTLAKQLNTLDALHSNEDLKKYFSWVKKQKLVFDNPVIQ